MKKITGIALSALLLISALFLASCKGSGRETQKTEDPNTAVLADFDSYGSGFQLMRFLNDFGRVTMNTAPENVKSGTGSAKLQPLGSYTANDMPAMYLPFKSAALGYDYTDTRKLESISVEIFNAESKDLTFTMGLVGGILDHKTVEFASAYTRTLRPGWNTVDYLVEHDIVNISYDVKNINGVYFQFDNAGSRDIEDAPVLYMDDLLLHFLEEEKQIADLVTLGENEICDFERLYQKYIITADFTNAKCRPDIAVTDSSVGITPVSGDHMLRLVTHAGDADQASWPRIVIPEKIMQKSVMKEIPATEYENWYFTFSVYNNSDTAMRFYPEFYSKGGAGWQAFSFMAYPNSWTEYSLPLSEIAAQNVKDPGFFKLAWGEYTTEFAHDLEFFLDDFKIVEK